MMAVSSEVVTCNGRLLGRMQTLAVMNLGDTHSLCLCEGSEFRRLSLGTAN